MVARNNNDNAFLLPTRIFKGLFRMTVCLVVVALGWHVAALVCFGVIIGIHLHANPHETLLLPPSESLHQYFNTVDRHSLLPSSVASSISAAFGAAAANCTAGCCDIITLLTTIPVIVHDPIAFRVVLDSMVHHVSTAEPWSQILGVFVSLLVLRIYKYLTRSWWPFRHYHDHNQHSRTTTTTTNRRLHALVTAALKKHRAVVGVVAAPMREEEISVGACPTSSSSSSTSTSTGGGLCGICLDGLHPAADKNVVEGCCRHTFHVHCISEWLCRGDDQSHYQCPLCRQDFLDTATSRKLQSSFWNSRVGFFSSSSSS